MAAKLRPAQRDAILQLLADGIDSGSIALEVGATVAQVAAIAAHRSMGRYAQPPQSQASLAEQQQSSEREAACSVVIGRTPDGELVRWLPSGASGVTNPHFLIVGESGSGKTYTTQCVCAELVQQGVPVVVLDFGQGYDLKHSPKQFASFARAVPIHASRDGLNVNPLQIFPGDIHGPVTVAQRVSDTLARVYSGIGVQQHAVLREALLRTFEDHGITANDKDTWRKPIPEFETVNATLTEWGRDNSRSDRRTAASVAAHISTLFVFNTFRRTGESLDWASMLRDARTHIIQLDRLEHSLERAVGEMVLWNFLGYLESLGPGALRCFMLIDEAHRMSFAPTSPVEKFLREARKFGVGLILASQQPEDFSPVAFSNTASKLILRVDDARGLVTRQLQRALRPNLSTAALVRAQLSELHRGEGYFIQHRHNVIVSIDAFEARSTRWNAGQCH